MTKMVIIFLLLASCFNLKSQSLSISWEHESSFNDKFVSPVSRNVFSKMGLNQKNTFSADFIFYGGNFFWHGLDIDYSDGLYLFSSLSPGVSNNYNRDSRLINTTNIYLGFLMASENFGATRYYLSLGPMYQKFNMNLAITSPCTGDVNFFTDDLNRFGLKVKTGLTYLSESFDRWIKRVDVFGSVGMYSQNINTLNYRYRYQLNLNVNLIEIFSIGNLYLSPSVTLSLDESELTSIGYLSPKYFGGLAIASHKTGLDLIKVGWGERYFQNLPYNIGHFHFSVNLGALSSLFP